MLKKFVILGLISVICSTVALAEPKDWQGSFTVLTTEDNVETVKHTANKVTLSFLNVSGCIYLNKGSSFNGAVMKETVALCVDKNIDDFTAEVQKLGQITSMNIKPDATYSRE